MESPRPKLRKPVPAITAYPHFKTWKGNIKAVDLMNSIYSVYIILIRPIGPALRQALQREETLSRSTPDQG